jgi:endonuclease YncB( thermonuclease family)
MTRKALVSMWSIGVLLFFVAFAVALIVVGIARGAEADPIIGYARIIDGDTIIVQDRHIRLAGIDAPELEQICADDGGDFYRCGLLATDVLNEIIGNHTVVCVPTDTDKYGRTVAVCSARGVDIGGAMVERGFALDYTFFSHGRYAKEMAHAMQAKRGMWMGTFQKPWDWRRDHQK